METTWRAPGVVALVWLLAGCGGEPGGRALPQATTQPAELAAVTAAAPSRYFAVAYTAKIPAVPAGAKRLDLWMPVPSSDAQQAVRDVRVITSLPHELAQDSEYGNVILHVWSDQPLADSIDVTVRYTVERRAEQAFPSQQQANVSRTPEPDDRLLAPDRLGVIDDRIRALAARITAGKADTLAKARAIYDYVLAHMTYDKQAPGWGQGDTRRACEVGKGNCTDFHALFISLARASGIPARFGIRFQVPPGQREGTLAGYHCWAEFWLPGTGWVPVDASEAWKDPGKRAFYFGGLDDDRFRVSLGRDVRLPGRDGEPVNYLLTPVAEADGRAIAAEKVVTFTAHP
ncbi:MAG TPA: transglutaminase domain-containing protein [Tepidisphaeraceae bacterium]|jgi:transglutaminase-like putative cysteine protease